MIVNVLRFTFKPETTPEERATVLSAMRRTASLPSVAFGTVGRDIGDPARDADDPGEGYTHVLSVSIPDLDSLEDYMYDPIHLSGDDEILPRLARLSAVRFSDDADPEIAEKVAAIAMAKFARFPEWAKTLSAIPA